MNPENKPSGQPSFDEVMENASTTPHETESEQVKKQQEPRNKAVTAVVSVIIGLVLVVVIGLITAFVYPGWASNFMKPNQQATSVTVQKRSEQKATATPDALPADATTLLKAMPDLVGSYARKTVADSQDWQSANPIEAHSVVYSTGEEAQNVTLVVGQWSKDDAAQSQYETLVKGLSGKLLASGDVMVSGKQTGQYEVHETGSGSATAVWRNATCVFQVSGNTDAVKNFYQQFPL